jgi:hypothetical protein
MNPFEDHETRFSEGWSFLQSPIGRRSRLHPNRIIGYASDTPFATDQEARDFVVKRAAEGSEYHQVCLAYIMQERMTK